MKRRLIAPTNRYWFSPTNPNICFNTSTLSNRLVTDDVVSAAAGGGSTLDFLRGGFFCVGVGRGFRDALAVDVIGDVDIIVVLGIVIDADAAAAAASNANSGDDTAGDDDDNE